jgi:hypothetical protein
MDFENMPIDAMLGMLDIPITPDVQQMLDNAQKYLPDAPPWRVLAVIMGLRVINGIQAYAARSLSALEGAAADLHTLSVEAELTREAITENTKAIYNHTSEAFHEVR